eukprot:g4054.t1
MALSQKEMMARFNAEQAAQEKSDGSSAVREAREEKQRIARQKREALLRERKEKAERERWEAHAASGYWFRVEKEVDGHFPCLHHKHFQHHPLCVQARTVEDLYRNLGPLLFAQMADMDAGAKFPSSVIGRALPCSGGSGHGMTVFVHALVGSAANEYELQGLGAWVACAGHGYVDGDRVRVLNPNAATARTTATVAGARHAEFTLSGDVRRVYQGLPGARDDDWVLMRMDPERYSYHTLDSLAPLRTGAERSAETRVKIVPQSSMWQPEPVCDATRCCLCGGAVGACRRRIKAHMRPHRVLTQHEKRDIVRQLARFRPETRHQICGACYVFNMLERDPEEHCRDLREQLFAGSADEDRGFEQVLRSAVPSSRHSAPETRLPPCASRHDRALNDPWAAGRHGTAYYLDDMYQRNALSDADRLELEEYIKYRGDSAVPDGHEWHYNL